MNKNKSVVAKLQHWMFYRCSDNIKQFIHLSINHKYQLIKCSITLILHEYFTRVGTALRQLDYGTLIRVCHEAEGNGKKEIRKRKVGKYMDIHIGSINTAKAISTPNGGILRDSLRASITVKSIKLPWLIFGIGIISCCTSLQTDTLIKEEKEQHGIMFRKINDGNG